MAFPDLESTRELKEEAENPEMLSYEYTGLLPHRKGIH